MSSDIETLCAVSDATWPPAHQSRVGPWTIREGQGGGKRVSSASTGSPVGEADLAQAEAAMRALEQVPLFRVGAGQRRLDQLLAGRGYRVIDPVNGWLGPLAPLVAEPLPRGHVFAIWEPLVIQTEIWAEGGIGAGRLAVMARAPGPKTAILSRLEQTPAATAFVAIHAGIAMVHALTVAPACRRHGVARLVMRQAAHWARKNGAARVAALCTTDNAPANALYASLGLSVVGQYHYRIAEKGPSHD